MISTVPRPVEVSLLLIVPPLVAASAMSPPVALSASGVAAPGSPVALVSPTVTLVTRDNVSELSSAENSSTLPMTGRLAGLSSVSAVDRLVWSSAAR